MIESLGFLLTHFTYVALVLLMLAAGLGLPMSEDLVLLVVGYLASTGIVDPWITLVLVVAYAGQVVGGVLFGAVVSSFVGALLMTPVAMLAAVRRSGPPFLVTFLPGFWVLVPGSLGLVGVTSALDASTTRALTTIVTTGVSMVAICLGVLAGLALGGLLQRRIAPDAPRIV